MWSLYASIAGVVLFGGLALASMFSRSKIAGQLGEANGKIDALEAELVESNHEKEALRIALARALKRVPTLDDLDRVSSLEAGGRADPAASIDVP